MYKCSLDTAYIDAIINIYIALIITIDIPLTDSQHLNYDKVVKIKYYNSYAMF